MAPLLLAAASVVALGVAVAILRSFGPRYRVGRLLAVVRQVPIAEAVRLADAGERRYVRVDGRIDSESDWEDEHHRPLVLRRTTVSWSSGGRPGSMAVLRAVPFVIREGLDEIAVDGEALGAGLVVVPRVSRGRVADIVAADPAIQVGGLDLIRQHGFPEKTTATSDDPVELRVEQVSSVEHVTVLGVPARAADGRAVIGPGLGRPLILTTLERDEAMRVLTGGASGRSRLAIACLAAGAVLVAVAALLWIGEALLGGGVATALAASPDPTLQPGGDIRSGGAAGFVGEPGLAILGVVAVALVSLLGTLAWVRFTGGRRAPR